MLSNFSRITYLHVQEARKDLAQRIKNNRAPAEGNATGPSKKGDGSSSKEKKKRPEASRGSKASEEPGSEAHDSASEEEDEAGRGGSSMEEDGQDGEEDDDIFKDRFRLRPTSQREAAKGRFECLPADIKKSLPEFEDGVLDTLPMDLLPCSVCNAVWLCV